jgi:hypothetical protein
VLIPTQHSQTANDSSRQCDWPQVFQAYFPKAVTTNLSLRGIIFLEGMWECGNLTKRISAGIFGNPTPLFLDISYAAFWLTESIIFDKISKFTAWYKLFISWRVMFTENIVMILGQKINLFLKTSNAAFKTYTIYYIQQISENILCDTEN